MLLPGDLILVPNNLRNWVSTRMGAIPLAWLEQDAIATITAVRENNQREIQLKDDHGSVIWIPKDLATEGRVSYLHKVVAENANQINPLEAMRLRLTDFKDYFFVTYLGMTVLEVLKADNPYHTADAQMEYVSDQPDYYHDGHYKFIEDKHVYTEDYGLLDVEITGLTVQPNTINITPISDVASIFLDNKETADVYEDAEPALVSATEAIGGDAADTE